MNAPWKKGGMNHEEESKQKPVPTRDSECPAGCQMKSKGMRNMLAEGGRDNARTRAKKSSRILTEASVVKKKADERLEDKRQKK